MAELVLIRGIPGSGKSTMAKRDFPNHAHVEADMYFEDEFGNTNFDGSKLKDAHRWCEEITRKLIESGRDTVVSNTFTRIWEMEPYFHMGADEVKVVEATGNWKNVHGVPESTIKRMRDRYEEYVPPTTDRPVSEDEVETVIPENSEDRPKRRRPGQRPKK